MRARLGRGVLFAVVAVAGSAGLSEVFDARGWVKIVAVVGAAILAAFAPSYVDWLLKRAESRRRVEKAREPGPAEGPAGLLRADRHVVPFSGRVRELRALRDWCRGDNSPVRLVVGAGGVGKTRLALELGKYLTSCGWSVTVVGAGREADALADLRLTTRRSILLVVDYAETRTGLAELLRSVSGHAPHVRVLLIARGVGDWWRQLESDGPVVRRLVGAYPPMELSTGVDGSIDPAELARAAVPHFARALGVPAPAHVDVTVPREVPPLLVLHAAALVAVLRHARRADPVSGGRLVADLGVLDELLGHERRFWGQSAAARPGLGGLGPEVIWRAVAVACLFPAEDENDGAEILRRVPDLGDDARLRLTIARWLRQLYPTGSAYWGAPAPELVTEAHVMDQLGACPELLMTKSHTPSADQASQMLTVLSMAADHRPAGRELLEQVLRADPEGLVCRALAVARVAGGGLPRVLEKVLADAPLTPESLRAVDRAIPYPTTVLAGPAVVVAHRILEELPDGTDDAERAHWHARLGVMQARAGRPAAAQRDTQAAVELYRTLFEGDRDRFRPDLARCLHNLGRWHAEQGHHDDAVGHAQDAQGYYQALGEPLPDRYLPEYAACLNNLGAWLVELDRRDDALPLLTRAVQSYRRLVEIDLDGHVGDLAGALTNLDLCNAGLPQRRVEPLPQLKTVVERCRVRARDDPDQHRPDLARSLHNLGDRHVGLGEDSDALAALEEALPHYHTLAEANPGRYRPGVAACLNDIGVVLSRLSRHAEAVDRAREAVDLNRGLAGESAHRYRAELARSLDNLVVLLSRMGRHADVIAAAEEAVALHKDLNEINSGRHDPELARALTNLGVSQSELGRHAEAVRRVIEPPVGPGP